MSHNAATLRVEVDSRPESLALIRAVLSAVADLLEFDAELANDIKTAVSEASNNVVLHAYDEGTGPLTLELAVDDDTVGATVTDHGSGISHVAPSEDRMGVGLAVISALADRAEFRSGKDGGTEVRITFRRLMAAGASGDAAVELENLRPVVSGEVTVALSPVTLLGEVLGRVARALAAGARFSLDRFSDVYLVADAIGAHVEAAAVDDAISFAINPAEQRLEVSVGPLRPGTGAQLEWDTAPDRLRSPLAMLVDELVIEPVDDGETLRVVLADTQGMTRERSVLA